MAAAKTFTSLFFILWMLLGCAGLKPGIPVEDRSSQPGTQVTVRGKSFKLLGSPVSIGKPLPSVELVDAITMDGVDLSTRRGSVLFLSIVPSLDTPVCDAQTHTLGEQGKGLPKSVERIVISRDTPFAQKRFAKEAKLTDLRYLSDYKQGDFGRSTGLLTEGMMLLARSVIIVDKRGIVRYLQVVPEMSRLPNMERAFETAAALSKEE